MIFNHSGKLHDVLSFMVLQSRKLNNVKDVETH